MTSPTVVAGVRRLLVAHPPFSMMTATQLDTVASSLALAYFAAGETVIDPQSGPPTVCYIIKQGVVDRIPPSALDAADNDVATRKLMPGEMFPVGAMMAERAPGNRYRAATDLFCWTLPKPVFDDLLRHSDVFLDFCKRRTAALLDLSRQALQAAYAGRTAQWREMASPLGELVRRPPVTVDAGTTLRDVFELMERETVGSVIVDRADASGELGIFTRQDVVGRVVLPGVSLDAPISDVMTTPVVTIDADATVADAMLTMAQRSIRHLPVTRESSLVGVITERDLFVLQRQTLRSVGDSIRSARDLGQLTQAAADIRAWSRSLVTQGISAPFATRLISRLNDQLTQRLIARNATLHRLSLEQACWLAMGSEGRDEQTIATDQDNGLVLADVLAPDRDRYLAFAQQVNQDLDACGYPLCKGGIMAGNPAWCLTRSAWRDRFDDWIDRGDPQSLLAASIFFDFRGLAGDLSLATALREHVRDQASATPRFLKQMSDNALANGPPASWSTGLIGQLFGQEQNAIDLKMNGTVPFVDGARLLALAHRITATSTAERLQAVAESGAVPQAEVQGWLDAFQFLQGLRLRIQHEEPSADADNPNLLDTSRLSELDRRILKETFRQARLLQQRLALDWPG